MLSIWHECIHVYPYGGLRFPSGSESKESTCNVGDLGLIPGWRRSPGEGNGNTLQDSCLGNPRESGPWWARVQELDTTELLIKWIYTQIGLVHVCMYLNTHGYVCLYTHIHPHVGVCMHTALSVGFQSGCDTEFPGERQAQCRVCTRLPLPPRCWNRLTSGSAIDWPETGGSSYIFINFNSMQFYWSLFFMKNKHSWTHSVSWDMKDRHRRTGETRSAISLLWKRRVPAGRGYSGCNVCLCPHTLSPLAVGWQEKYASLSELLSCDYPLGDVKSDVLSHHTVWVPNTPNGLMSFYLLN